MPFKRRFRRRRRRRRKSGSKALRIAFKALNQSRPEKKNVTISHTANITSTGAVISLFNLGIGVGAGTSQYVGKQLRLHSVSYRGRVSTASDNASFTVVRLIIGLYFDDALPAVSNILSLASPYSPYSQGNATRFTILWDKSFSMNTDTKRGSMFIKRINLRNTLCTFTTESTALPNNVQPFLLEISTAGSNVPQSDGIWRLRFTDV